MAGRDRVWSNAGLGSDLGGFGGAGSVAGLDVSGQFLADHGFDLTARRRQHHDGAGVGSAGEPALELPQISPILPPIDRRRSVNEPGVDSAANARGELLTGVIVVGDVIAMPVAFPLQPVSSPSPSASLQSTSLNCGDAEASKDLAPAFEREWDEDAKGTCS